MSKWNRNCLMFILGCILVLAALQQAPPDIDDPVTPTMRQEIVSRWQDADDHWQLDNFKDCSRCHGVNGEALLVRR